MGGRSLLEEGSADIGGLVMRERAKVTGRDRITDYTVRDCIHRRGPRLRQIAVRDQKSSPHQTGDNRCGDDHQRPPARHELTESAEHLLSMPFR
jgi:hypothetical protein